jgi:hypothetical protein
MPQWTKPTVMTFDHGRDSVLYYAAGDAVTRRVTKLTCRINADWHRGLENNLGNVMTSIQTIWHFPYFSLLVNPRKEENLEKST